MVGLTKGYGPRWVQFEKDGKTAWLDVIDGKFSFGGDMEANEAAKMFLECVGHHIDARIIEAAKKLAAESDASLRSSSLNTGEG